MNKQRCFNIPATSRREEITSASHPWASFAAGLQSHTQVCSFQSATKSASRLRPLRYRNFKERALKQLSILLLAAITSPVYGESVSEEPAEFTDAFTIRFRSDADTKVNQRLHQSSSFVEDPSNFIIEESLDRLQPYSSFYSYNIKARSYTDVYYRMEGIPGSDGAYGFLDMNSGSYQDAYGAYVVMEFRKVVEMQKVVLEICPMVDGASVSVSGYERDLSQDTGSSGISLEQGSGFRYYEIPFSTSPRANLYIKFPRYAADGTTLNHCCLRSITIVPQGAEWENPDSGRQEIDIVFPDNDGREVEFYPGRSYGFPMPCGPDGSALDRGSLEIRAEAPSGVSDPVVSAGEESFFIQPSDAGIYTVRAEYDDGRRFGSASTSLSIYPAFPSMTLCGVEITGGLLVVSAPEEELARARVSGIPDGTTLWWRTGADSYRRYTDEEGIDLRQAKSMDIYMERNGAVSPEKHFSCHVSSVSAGVSAAEGSALRPGGKWYTLQGREALGIETGVAPGIYIYVDPQGQARIIAVDQTPK